MCAAGGGAAAAQTPEVEALVCTKSAKMLLRDDVTACVQGVVDALHGLHGKGSKEPITALREMHVHLSQSVIRDMISKEDRQKHAGASRAHRDARAHPLPSRSE